MNINTIQTAPYIYHDLLYMSS